MDNKDFKGINDFKNYVINILKSHKFAGINLISLTPNGRLIALGVNIPKSMKDVQVGFKALYSELEDQIYSNNDYKDRHSPMQKENDFHFQDNNEKDKKDMKKDINKFLDNSPKSQPQISDPEDCGPSGPSHEDPLTQAEEIIKNHKNH